MRRLRSVRPSPFPSRHGPALALGLCLAMNAQWGPRHGSEPARCDLISTVKANSKRAIFDTRQGVTDVVKQSGFLLDVSAGIN